MSRKKQTEQTAEKKKISGGKLLAAVIGIVVTVYLLLSLNVFYQFVHILFEDPDAAHQQETTLKALDEIYGEEEE